MGAKPTIAQNVGLLTAANLLMRGVSMLFQVYLTARVGAAGVGLLQLILSVNLFAVTLGTSGLRVAALYLSAEAYGLRRYGGVRQAMVWCLTAGLLLSALVGGAMMAFAEPLALSVVGDLRAVLSLRLLGLTLPLSCLSMILSGCFTACGQVRTLVAVEVGDKAATVVLTMLLLQQGIAGDLAHACAAIVGGNALAAVGSVAVLLGLLRRWLGKLDGGGAMPDMGRRLLGIAGPVAVSDYLRSGLGTLEQFLIPWGLSRFGGSHTQAMADYGVIHGMVFPVLMFPCTVLYAVADVLVPELARCRAEENQRRIRHVAGRCLRQGFLYAAAVAALLWLLAMPLGQLLYRSDDAGRYLRLFAPAVVMLYLDCLVDGMHKGLGQQVYTVRVNTLTSILDVALLYLLLPRWGIAGYYVSFWVSHGVNFYLSIRRLGELTGPLTGRRTPDTIEACSK
ncbi:MAG TPA: oligosaccharide flippase family protein [Candidatus Avoscillospira stercorigallinarum]|uniref:Oligosaccharide flippase family protein n=1 Tax=Candidatus Avoscillospira stercorigallinarum TaxID=2840708 RepID=A0A9D1CPJ0_9FIRM|nr:oligosaccharide flippase family protein [Candidatus Avoscillospira stercorigallinarum]